MPFMPTKSRKTKDPVEEPVFEPLEEIPFAEESAILEEDTITLKRSHFYAIVSLLTFFAGILVGYMLWGTGLLPGLGSNPVTAAQAGGPVVEAPVTNQPQRYDVPSEGHYSIGPADAPIVIVEFSDYQCPFCRRWHDEVYQDLLAAYPGQIRLVYRHLPLTSIHPDAFSAAEAALCAGEQGAYWQFHEKLFSSDALGNAVYLRYAQDLNLNQTSFEACLNDGKYQDAVQADMDFAVNLGVRSTPTFFINGLAVVGAQPLNVFQQIIDQELAGEIP